MHKNTIHIPGATSVILIVLIALTGFVRADVFVKQEEQTEAVYHHGNVEPATQNTSEVWIGKKKLAYREGNLGFLVDLDKGKAFVINHSTKTFAESSLPFRLGNVADEEFAPRLEMFRTQGEIKHLNKEKKIGDRACTMTEITTWVIYEGVRYNETIREICLATDLPFDLKAAKPLLKETQGLNNYDEEFYAKIDALEGFPIASTSTQYMEGISIPSSMETLEMTVKEAPAGTYAIPDDYTKKDKLTRAEILGQ